MSKFVKVRTQLTDLETVRQALRDLKVEFQEEERYSHRWSGFSGTVPILVKHGRINFGLRATDEGPYEVLADDMHMQKIRPLMDKVQQRYAYHKVVAEAKKAGFSLVEEKVGRDEVIRLTVRRWS